MRASSVGDGRPYFARYHCSDQLFDCATMDVLATMARTAVNRMPLVDDFIRWLLNFALLNALGMPRLGPCPHFCNCLSKWRFQTSAGRLRQRCTPIIASFEAAAAGIRPPRRNRAKGSND